MNMKGQRGAISVTGLLLGAIGMIFLAVGFIVFPIVTAGTDALLDYSFSGDPTITDATFTGFTAIVGITPLLVLLGFVTVALSLMFLGGKMERDSITTPLNPISVLLLAISVIFIAVGVIIMPVVLDGVAGNLVHQASQTDTQTGVTTAVATSVGNVTLTQTLALNDVTEVTSLSSNISETLVADNYTSPLLFLTGLTANTTRTVTTVYDFQDSLAQYSGTFTFLLITPLLVLVGFLSGAVISGFFGVRKLTA